MRILAIDTSCDETSVAVSNDDRILSNVISSQVDLHRKWGGVVPAIAKRAHEENIEPAIKEALKRARVKINEIDIFAVTQGPGLAIALEVGIRKIKELAKIYRKPVVAVNHMVGHIMANFAKNSKGQYWSNLTNWSNWTNIPILALLISGGHTELVLVKNFGQYKKIGLTLDDAIGEAYDKVAKMLNLGYPGGPIIEELAKQGNREKYDLPVPMAKLSGLDFSYSGLKTSVLYLIKKIQNKNLFFDNDRELNISQLTRKQIIDIVSSFEKVAAEHLCQRLDRALKIHQARIVLLGGGVVSNRYIRSRLRIVVRKHKIPMIWPGHKNLCTDNAAMIAVAGFYQAKRGDFIKNFETLDRQPNLSL